MISYEEYKKLYNPQNEYIEFFDVTSWKKENYRNYLLSKKTTPNDYIAPTKLEILSQKKKECQRNNRHKKEEIKMLDGKLMQLGKCYTYFF